MYYYNTYHLFLIASMQQINERVIVDRFNLINIGTEMPKIKLYIYVYRYLEELYGACVYRIDQMNNAPAHRSFGSCLIPGSVASFHLKSLI